MGRATAATIAVGLSGRPWPADASAVARSGAVLPAAAVNAAAAANGDAADDPAAIGAWLLRATAGAGLFAPLVRSSDQRSDRTGTSERPAERTGWAADGAAVRQPTGCSSS